MNDDFLSSLAAQTLGTASVIRPRVASRFEQRLAANHRRPRWSEPAELEIDVPDSPEPTEIKTLDHISPPHAITVDPRPDLATISPMAGRVMTWNIETEKGAPIGPPAPPGPPERAIEIAGLDLAAQPDLRQEPPLMASARAANAPHLDDLVTQETLPLTSNLAQPPLRPTRVVEEIRPARQSGIAVQARRADREVLARQEPVDSEPTIHVTIGRVEVRATTSAATQPASRPASPIMTLEEYLRRKTERGNS